MTLLKYYECENCKTRNLIELMSGWLNVRVLVGNQAELERYMSGDENALDVGDFCGLKCVGEWALARANLKMLDMELEGGGVVDDDDGGS